MTMCYIVTRAVYLKTKVRHAEYPNSSRWDRERAVSVILHGGSPLMTPQNEPRYTPRPGLPRKKLAVVLLLVSAVLGLGFASGAMLN